MIASEAISPAATQTPYRSVRIRSAATPAAISASAAAVTKALAPQTKASAGGSGSVDSTLRDHRAVDAPAKILVSPRRVAGERQRQVEAVAPVVERQELVAEDHLVPLARRIEQRHRRPACRSPRGGAPCWSAARRRSRRRSAASGPGSSADQTKCPPSGPLISISSPTAATSWKKGETSPSSSFSMASSISSPASGAEAIE